MTFLKKLGSILLKGTSIISGFAPLAPPAFQPIVSQTISILDEVVKIVVQTEAIGQALALPGADKLKAATPIVSQLLLQADAFKGRKIDNPILFAEGAANITDGVVKILNSFKDDVEVS